MEVIVFKYFVEIQWIHSSVSMHALIKQYLTRADNSAVSVIRYTL